MWYNNYCKSSIIWNTDLWSDAWSNVLEHQIKLRQLKLSNKCLKTCNASCFSSIARLLLSQVINSDVISVDTLLTVQEVQTVVLSCRSSNTPRWYNGTDLISSISSDPVYQTSVNRSTKFLRIRAYTNSDKGQYTCRDTVNSIQLERSISLTTGECVAVDIRHLVKIPNYIFVQKVIWLIFRTHLQIIVYWTPSFEYHEYHQLSYCRNFCVHFTLTWTCQHSTDVSLRLRSLYTCRILSICVCFICWGFSVLFSKHHFYLDIKYELLGAIKDAIGLWCLQAPQGGSCISTTCRILTNYIWYCSCTMSHTQTC